MKLELITYREYPSEMVVDIYRFGIPWVRGNRYVKEPFDTRWVDVWSGKRVSKKMSKKLDQLEIKAKNEN